MIVSAESCIHCFVHVAKPVQQVWLCLSDHFCLLGIVIIGTVSSKITLVVLLQNVQDKQKKAFISMAN